MEGSEKIKNNCQKLSLSWEHVNVKVNKNGIGDEKELVKNVSGIAKPGQLVGIFSNCSFTNALFSFHYSLQLWDHLVLVKPQF